MEEGTPTEFSEMDLDNLASVQESAMPTKSPRGFSRAPLAVASTKGAWQRVYWADPINLAVNDDVTQINWTYNGSTVSSGSAAGYWHWFTPTGWANITHNVSQGFFSGAFRGQTTSTFVNFTFCPQPLPDVYTYYYYNRVWGHANGTSTRSQSSDSVDECLPLHVGLQSAYGQWSG